METNTSTIPTTQFASVTQYDKQFDGLFANPNKKGFSCSFFSLISAWKFLNDETPDVISHETTIAQSLLAQSSYDINFGITFEEMLSSYTDINPTQIYATTANLINSGELGFDQIFPPILDNTRIAIIILKNERYLTVLIDQNGYQFRDCHESTQYNFGSVDELVIHLINAYQFTDDVNAGGIEYHDYSSIEFLVLNSKFYLGVAEMLGIAVSSSTPVNLNGDTFDIPSGTTLSSDEICYLEILNNEVNETSDVNQKTVVVGDMSTDEMLYMQMLNAEINGTTNTNAQEDFDIPIEQMGDFSGDNDVADVELEDEFVDFE